ncbi:unnamed protein product [Anisakis simplex]|uniref:TPR_REGION domain-containing protein n=1 Tax=Anisakis simplex TaxID=6269 RepID=A0A0M3KH09_ANISI|nr:unnamed protein product [Anisakis simplex]
MKDSRYRLLILRPQQRFAWIGYATAYHLLKDYDMALKIVNEFCNNNKVAFIGDLLMRLKQHEDAERVYWQLVERNPENIEYYKRIEQCHEDDVDERYEIYKKALTLKPRAAAPKRAPLYFLKGAEFEKQLLSYLVAGLRKGVPSLFKNLVPLYADNDKVQLLERTLIDFVKRLEENGYKNGSLDG